ALAADVPEHAVGRGGFLLHSPRRRNHRPAVCEAVRELRVRPRGAGGGRGGRPVPGIRVPALRLATGRAVRAVLFQRETTVRRAVGRSGGQAVAIMAVLLTARPPDRLTAQDTSAIDRGVRIGIVYRPGVRPGVVVLPGRAPALDSVRAIVARDLDYSDRFELITLPSGDSIRVATAAPAAAARSGRPGAGGG